MENKIMIWGQALVQLWSSRSTKDTDYLIFDEKVKKDFLHDEDNHIDYCNAWFNKFFKEIYKIEKWNKIATPQSLLELKAYAFVQHCKNMNFQKADDCEYDMKFLIRKFDLQKTTIVNKYVNEWEMSEINRVFKNTNK